jgi:hypothetical protein
MTLHNMFYRRHLYIPSWILVAWLLAPGAASSPAQQAPTRSLADAKLLRTLELKGKTYHVQGIDFDSEHIWITSCDRPGRKGFLYQFSLATGEQERVIEIQDGDRFHPGGIDTDADSIWLPVAEYRPKSTSVIQQRNKRTFKVEFQFSVPDHIGCIAVTPEFLIGGNWDSREFYVWSRRGQLIRKVANTSGNNYQDMKFASPHIVASGVFPGRAGGAIDWLDLPDFHLVRRLTAGNNDRNLPFTREGMAIRANRLLLLPEDDQSRVFIFQNPL